ncbi:MAG: transcription termination/antitermination protein NusA [Terriglobia bacterium]|nr:MAG: transcription termination/antitermination protein NusA [Terriglobia bacterium]
METIFQSIEILSKEKGIDPQIVLDAVKDAMLIAARKHYRTNEDYIADMDPKTGAIQLYAVKKVVEAVTDPAHEMTMSEARRIDSSAEIGSEVRIPKNTEALGRISAQTAKQVIFQKVREAERETVFLEYSGRTGELVNCTIKRVEGPDYILDLGKTEARLPKKEQSRLESYSVGDRVRCVIRLVDKSSKGPGVLVSRAAPELVMRLFEQEVPEIYDGTVAIKNCAREAGERTKIAVQSRDRDVDSVGACVGMKGMRVQSIIRELRGEKIDIIEYSEDPVVFATHALSPAKVSRITIIDPLEKHMEVIVDDSQLSLAIGKKGQNVRLAAKLLGWKIDIKSEEEKRQEVESAMAALVGPGAPVSSLIEYGLPESVAGKLVESGVGTIDKLGSMTPEQLEEIQGIGAQMVEQIQVSVNAYYSQFEEQGQAAAQEEVIEEVLQPEGEATPDFSTAPEELAEVEGVSPDSLETEPQPLDELTETVYPPGTPYDTESPEERFEPGTPEAEAEQFGRIEGAGSPNHNSDGAEPEAEGGQEGAPEKDRGE